MCQTVKLTQAQLGYSASLLIDGIVSDGGERGYALYAASRLFGVSVRTIRRWLAAYRKSALGGGSRYEEN